MIVEEKNRSMMVFRKEFNGEPVYTLGMSHKNMDGTYNAFYPRVRFRKGVEVPNMTKIKNIKGFVDGYIDKNGSSVVYFVITEFELDAIAGNAIPNGVAELQKVIKEPVQVEQDDEELPF